MNIGMIDAGIVARAVARFSLPSGHTVVLSSQRGPDCLRELVTELGEGATVDPVEQAAKLDVVLFAVPRVNTREAFSGLPDWGGGIPIDATNPFVETSPKLVLADLGDQGASETVSSYVPGARVVNAFNSIVMSNFEGSPKRWDARRVLFVSGRHRS